MNFASTSRVKRNQNTLRSSLAGVAALSLIGLCSAAHAADKPPLAPDTVAPFSTGLAAVGSDRVQPAGAGSRYRAGYPAAARQHRRRDRMRASPGAVLEGQRQLRRLGLCRTVRRRLAVWPRRSRLRLGADPWRARGAGRQPLHRAHPWRDRGQRHDRSQARPQLGRDWSLDLNFSDGFRWSEPPVLQVMGREIPLAKYAEPRIRAQLARGQGACAGRGPPPRSA